MRHPRSSLTESDEKDQVARLDATLTISLVKGESDGGGRGVAEAIEIIVEFIHW